MDRNRITGAARQVAGRLRAVAGTAGHEAALRAEDAYDDAAGLGGRLFGQAREQAAYLADDAYATGRRLYGRGLTSLQRQAGAHPVALVLAAGIAGAAIAWVLSQPRR